MDLFIVADTADDMPVRLDLAWVGLILCLTLGLVGCAGPALTATAVPPPTLPPSPVPTATLSPAPTLAPSPEPSSGGQVYENPVMGIRLSYPAGDRIEEDPSLFSEYGFWLMDAAKEPVLGVVWFYRDPAADLQPVVNAAIREADHNLPIRQSALQVAGYPAVALYGMPGMYDNVQIYLAAHDRLYRLLYAGAELDQAARQLLDGFKVISATKTLESLHLPTGEPPSPPLAATDEPTPAAVTVLSGHTSPVTQLSWSPASALLASSCGGSDSTDNTVRVWRSDGKLAYVLTGHTQPVTSLAWSADGQILATGSLDGTIRLWSRTGQLLGTWQANAGRVFVLAWEPARSDVLASGSLMSDTVPVVQLWWGTGPVVQLWRRTGQVVARLSTSFSGDKFYNLAWSPDGKYLLGGATDYKLWRADGTEVISLPGCESCAPARGVAWSPASPRFAVGDENGVVRIFTDAGTQVATVREQGGVNSLAWSPDATRLASGRTLWDANGQVLAKLDGQPPSVNSIAWAPVSPGMFFATGGSDGKVRLWSADGQALRVFSGHTASVNVVAWSGGGLLASASDDQTIRLWKIP